MNKVVNKLLSDRCKQFNTIYIFGAGMYGKTAGWEIKTIINHSIMGYIDNNSKLFGKKIFSGIKCIAIDDVPGTEQGALFVVANKRKDIRDSISNQLNKLGFYNIVHYGEEESYNLFKSIDNDEDCVRIRWAIYIGENVSLNLIEPLTFNEKIQWLKLHDHNPLYTSLVDKYEVKSYVASKIGSRYVIPTLGVWDHFDDIDFSVLPESFVLKCTHDSGSIVICKNKNEMDISAIREKLEGCLARNMFYLAREWPYKNVKPRIIAEKYMCNMNSNEPEDKCNVGIDDYKLHVFNGKPRIIQVDYDRFDHHRRNLYDEHWNYIEAEICYPTDKSHVIEKPKCFDELMDIASKVSEGIPYVRSDFYIINEKIYFGELTFYHGGGYEDFRPKELGIKMGKMIDLPKNGSC